MKDYILKSLTKLLEKVDREFDYVNNGGCGITAKLIAEQLQKLVNEVIIVVWPSYWSDVYEVDLDAVRQEVPYNQVREWERRGVVFSHVWVEFKLDDQWYAADVKGVLPQAEMHKRWGEPFAGSFTVDEMAELAADSTGWNMLFDRSQIPKMESLVKQEFDTINHVVEEVYHA